MVSSTEEWIDACVKHLKLLESPGERYEFVHRLIYNLALFGGYNAYEMAGILEFVKLELVEDLNNTPPECDGDCDNCDNDE